MRQYGKLWAIAHGQGWALPEKGKCPIIRKAMELVAEAPDQKEGQRCEGYIKYKFEESAHVG